MVCVPCEDLLVYFREIAEMYTSSIVIPADAFDFLQGEFPFHHPPRVLLYSI